MSQEEPVYIIEHDVITRYSIMLSVGTSQKGINMYDIIRGLADFGAHIMLNDDRHVSMWINFNNILNSCSS